MKEKKVIAVSGASSGIGFEAARLLAEKGHIVYGGARTLSKLEGLKKFGVNVIPLDVTDEESARNFIETIYEKEGRIDVLINNAGYGEYGPIETTSLESAKRQLDVNVLGLTRMSKLVMPKMRERGKGTIVHVSSVGGKISTYFGGWYHASKHAVEALGDAMRMELRPFGIRVTLIEPSGVASHFGEVASDNLRESAKGTAYEKDAATVANAYQRMFAKKSFIMASPTRIGKKIRKVSLRKRPRARYRVGPFSTTLVVLRNILPARWFDGLMKGMLSFAGKEKK